MGKKKMVPVAIGGTVAGIVAVRSIRKRQSTNTDAEPEETDEEQPETATEHAKAAVEHSRQAAEKTKETLPRTTK